ncbi:MAG TPA: GNAT family N-acetyltransferase, partial [Aggregatilineaceae bacterium]|nr:GNAT family N-acetyltransferase [Aggregatilineaceae bacterium]
AYWPQSTYYGARRGGKLFSVLLTYYGLEPMIFTGFGDVDGMAAIFADLLLPEEMYFVMPPEMEPILAEWYDGLDEHMEREWRMVVHPHQFNAPEPIQETVCRLEPEHADALTILYALAANRGEVIISFTPWQIAHGVFYGVWDGETLVAAAGTHVWSPGEHIAAVGNVFTHPKYRGRGLATACTGGGGG